MWLKNVKVSLKITFSCLKLIYFLVHAESQAREEHDFGVRPTANQGYWRDFVIFPAFLVPLLRVLHIFLGKFLLFIQNKNFSKSNTFVSLGKMSLRIIAVVEKTVCAAKTFQ